MEIQETLTSHFRKISEMLERFIPYDMSYQIGKRSRAGYYVTDRRAPSSASLGNALEISPSGGRFAGGQWSDLEVTVKNKDFIEWVTKFCEEYERISGKKVTLIMC